MNDPTGPATPEPPEDLPPPPPPPPPPVGWAPTPAATAPNRLSVGEAIGYGWRGFTANLGPVLLIVIVLLAVSVAFGLLGALLDDEFAILLLNLANIVVSLVIAVGLIRAALAVTDGRRPDLGQVFGTRGLAPYVIASITLSIGYVVLNLLGVLTLILLPITLLLTLALSFFVQFFGYAILDEGVGAFDGITRSMTVVRANIGPTILLWLAAIGINIVGALLCGLGLLVSLPVTAIAWAYAWRVMTNGVIVPAAP